jgi:hypothetical protein
MEPQKGFVDIWRWLAPLLSMILSKSLIVGMICNMSIIHDFLHPLWHGRGHLKIWKDHTWMITMSLGVPMKFKLRNGSFISYPTMFPSLRGL